jgi:hypothetical protein
MVDEGVGFRQGWDPSHVCSVRRIASDARLREIFVSKDEESVYVLNGVFHNTLHLLIGQVRVLLTPKTGRAWLPGVKVFDRPIPERKGNDSLRFPRELIASAMQRDSLSG